MISLFNISHRVVVIVCVFVCRCALTRTVLTDLSLCIIQRADAGTKMRSPSAERVHTACTPYRHRPGKGGGYALVPYGGGGNGGEAGEAWPDVACCSSLAIININYNHGCARPYSKQGVRGHSGARLMRDIVQKPGARERVCVCVICGLPGINEPY